MHWKNERIGGAGRASNCAIKSNGVPSSHENMQTKIAHQQPNAFALNQIGLAPSQSKKTTCSTNVKLTSPNQTAKRSPKSHQNENAAHCPLQILDCSIKTKELGNALHCFAGKQQTGPPAPARPETNMNKQQTRATLCRHVCFYRVGEKNIEFDMANLHPTRIC